MLLRHCLIFLFVAVANNSFAQTQIAIPVQEEVHHPWTIALEGGYSSGVSSSMRGTNAEFRSQVDINYNNTIYPFGDPNAWGAGGGLNIEYRFLPGNFGVYVAGKSLSFTTSDASKDSAILNIGTYSVGAQYVYNVTSAIDVFGRAGINGSFIGGHLTYTYGTVEMTTPNFRAGFEAGAGIDWNPVSVLLVRAFVDYADVNVIGKTYTPPTPPPPGTLLVRGLNDGADPNNPSDKPRTIDYLLSGIGLGVRF